MTGARGLVPLPYDESGMAAKLGPNWAETLASAHRWMILARTLDARMQGLQRQGRVGFYGAATGQEAVNVAAGLVSAREDWVFPGLREQLVALVRGHPLVDYTHHLFADDLDAGRGRNMPCHPTARGVRYVSMSSVIGTQIDHAVGAAYAARYRHEPGAVLAFFGDGATSSNDFHAGMNFAGVFRLPVIFCCTNNQWAISVPVSRQTAVQSLATKAVEYGFPGRWVDGTDFVSAYAELGAALRQARDGGGPTMLEFVLYRMTAHSSSDDPTRYQPADWAARAAAHDPLGRLEGWMATHGLLDAEREAAVRASADAEVKAAVETAEATPPPRPESLTEDVYAATRSGAPAPEG
ncbi:MAG TPA: thiamine pyrophosphate-dependent enzyme [Thermoplasmata archaeon]|nr:thiamine pyrophosphate-dependent enzyme [Thermoplasmata archaeon]